MIEWELEFIANHRIAHLATVDSGDRPHVLPVVYAFNGERIYTPVEDKSKRTGPYKFSRVRNILNNHRIAFIVDDYDEDWNQLAWVQVRGSHAIKTKGAEYEKGIELLSLKYTQYQNDPIDGKPLIVITPQKVVGWRATDQEVKVEINGKAVLGKNVSMQINHPIGSRHQKDGFIFPVNYGIITGAAAKDGSELEAYLLGVYDPVTVFDGKCIAIIHRVGNNDKLVIAPEDVDFTDDQIKAMTDFQERFYYSEIIRS
jgi:inorganic pyrophosphatase